jgi:hypothetical protein
MAARSTRSAAPTFWCIRQGVVFVTGCLALVAFCRVADSPIEKLADKAINLLLPIEFHG